MKAFKIPDISTIPEWSLADRERYIELLADSQERTRIMFARINAKALAEVCKTIDDAYFIAYGLGVYNFEKIMEATEPDDKGKKAANFISNCQKESVQLYGN